MSAPIRVFRVGGWLRWQWYCNLCGRRDVVRSQRAALMDGLEHMRAAHGCPSLLASGEPCDEYCSDCGGKRWIK